MSSRAKTIAIAFIWSATAAILFYAVGMVLLVPWHGPAIISLGVVIGASLASVAVARAQGDPDR